MVACLLYHTRDTEDVARTVTVHLDTYSISAGKVLWNSRGREGGRDPPGCEPHTFPPFLSQYSPIFDINYDRETNFSDIMLI